MLECANHLLCCIDIDRDIISPTIVMLEEGCVHIALLLHGIGQTHNSTKQGNYQLQKQVVSSRKNRGRREEAQVERKIHL